MTAIETGASKPSPKIFTATLNKALLADAGDVQKIEQSGGATLIDSRPASFFSGKQKAPAAQAYGHIPGAVNLDSATFYDAAANRLKPQAELASIAAALPEGPCGWAAWDFLGKAPVIAPTLEVFRQARALNVTVFFITGRPESQRTATEQNLRAVGYEGYAALYMVPEGAHYASAVAFKMPVRAAIEAEGHTIIANMGDQPSDLAGGHAEKTFLLPNPFYRIP